MIADIEQIKKKIIYRSNYRGTKEMDKLLYSFVSKNINNMGKEKLLSLEKFLDIDDEKLYKFYYNIDDTNLYNFYNGFKTDFEFENNNINLLYKNFNYTQK